MNEQPEKNEIVYLHGWWIMPTIIVAVLSCSGLILLVLSLAGR